MLLQTCAVASTEIKAAEPCRDHEPCIHLHLPAYIHFDFQKASSSQVGSVPGSLVAAVYLGIMPHILIHASPAGHGSHPACSAKIVKRTGAQQVFASGFCTSKDPQALIVRVMHMQCALQLTLQGN